MAYLCFCSTTHRLQPFGSSERPIFERFYALNKDVFADYEFIEAVEQQNEEYSFATVFQVQHYIDLSVNASSQDDAIETIIEKPMSNAEPPLPAASIC